MTTSTTSRELGTTLERLRFFPRQVIGAEDMRLEQDYFRQKLRRIGSSSHKNKSSRARVASV